MFARTASVHTLVLVVAQGTRDRQRAVDALNHDRTTGVLNAFAFVRVDGLVVVGAQGHLVTRHENSSRVAAIDQVDVRGRDETRDRGRARLVLALVEFGHATQTVVQVEEALSNGTL